MHASPRPQWRTSSHSGAQNNCVQVAALLPASVGVRDSKNPDAGALLLPAAEWRTLTGRVKAGEFDLR